MRYLAAGLLAILTLLVAVSPRCALWLSGFHPLGAPDTTGLDQSPKAEARGATRFFTERNRVEVSVPRDMTAGEFLELYQLGRHVRKEIAEQLDIDELSDETLLKQGTLLELNLTPPEESLR